MARKLGENGFDKEPLILKLIQGICNDTNYMIRMDGVSFFKEYLKNDKCQEYPRFQQIYVAQLIELLNDEEVYIKMEAIEILTDKLDFIDN